MARVLVRISPEDAAQRLSSLLLSSKYEVHTGPGYDQAGDPAAAAQDILAKNPVLVIMDYLSDDAWSVKAMQITASHNPLIKFIFVAQPQLPPAHMVMALNEGAAAILTAPISSEALNTYVARTVARRKEELLRAEEMDRYQKLVDREKACSLGQAEELSRQKHLMRDYARLINLLLATGGAKTKRKVLLVTDSAFQAERFRKYLEDLNFQVVSAADGIKGLETARIEHPQIIVSDLEMPGLNGLELCQAVKNDDKIGPNHFIICTANQAKIKEVLKPEYKVDDCLLKPGQPEEFQEFTARVALGMLL